MIFNFYRMFASDNPQVSDTDIVVTVDINLFVMTPNILRFLDQHPNMNVWLPQYFDTADIATGTGETFNLNLIAMKAGAWKHITGYNDVGGDLEKLIQHFRYNITIPHAAGCPKKKKYSHKPMIKCLNYVQKGKNSLQFE